MPHSMFMRSQNPTQDSTNITIHLCRNGGEEAQDNDDIITIHHKGENIYHVFYRDGDFINKSHFQMNVLDGDELDTYLLSLFRLVASDRAPFKFIQFNIPTFPTLLYKPHDLTDKKIRSKLMHIMPILKSAIKVQTH